MVHVVPFLVDRNNPIDQDIDRCYYTRTTREKKTGQRTIIHQLWKMIPHDSTWPNILGVMFELIFAFLYA